MCFLISVLNLLKQLKKNTKIKRRSEALQMNPTAISREEQPSERETSSRTQNIEIELAWGRGAHQETQQAEKQVGEGECKSLETVSHEEQE